MLPTPTTTFPLVEVFCKQFSVYAAVLISSINIPNARVRHAEQSCNSILWSICWDREHKFFLLDLQSCTYKGG